MTKESGVDGMRDGMHAAEVLADIDEADALTEQAAHVIVFVDVEGSRIEGGENLGVGRVERMSRAARVVCCSQTLVVKWFRGRIKVLSIVYEHRG